MTTRPSTLRRTINARLGLGRPRTGQGDWVVSMPLVVSVLLGMMALVFMIGEILPRQTEWRMEYALGLVPARLTAGFEGRFGTTLLEGAGPLISHIFVHGNVPHIVLNGFGLAIFGTAVARRMRVEAPGRAGWWNTFAFLAFFFASGVAGALLYALVNAGSGILLVGASGAISGVMAGAMLFALRVFAPYGPEAGALVGPLHKPVLVTTLVYLGINLMTPLGLGKILGFGLDIAWEAHVGGYLFGLFVFPLFDRVVLRPRTAGLR